MEELTEDKEKTQEMGERNVEPVDRLGPLVTSPNTGSYFSTESKGDTDADRKEEITRKSGWKHQSLHPLDNLISPLDSTIQTRSKAHDLVAYSAFVSLNEPNNIKEYLKDLDWMMSMQEELHQF